MAYFAVYNKQSGVIENVVECPEFLAKTIHLESHQQYLKVESQVSENQYLVIDHLLVFRN